MGGVDIGWLISALASSATYLVARFPVAETRLTAPQIPP